MIFLQRKITNLMNFKKGFKLLSVAATLFCTSPLLTQAQSKLYVGGTVSPQLTGFATDYGTYKSIFGVAAGGSMELRFNNTFSIQLDPVFSMQGANRQYQEDNNYYGITYSYVYDRVEHFNQVQGHLLFKWNIPIGSERIIPYDDPDKTTFITVFAGGYGGYVLAPMSRVGSVTGTKYTLQPPATDPLGKDSGSPTFYDSTYSLIDYGMTVGAGMQFKLTHRTIFEITARYTRGLATIDNGGYKTDQSTLPIGYGHIALNADGTSQYQASNTVNTAIGLNLSLRHRFGGRD